MGGANSAVYDAERCGPSCLRAAAEEQARPAAVRQGLPKSSAASTNHRRAWLLPTSSGRELHDARSFLYAVPEAVLLPNQRRSELMRQHYGAPLHARQGSDSCNVATAMAAPQRLAPRPARPQVPQVALPPLPPPPPPLPRLLPPLHPQLPLPPRLQVESLVWPRKSLTRPIRRSSRRFRIRPCPGSCGSIAAACSFASPRLSTCPAKITSW